MSERPWYWNRKGEPISLFQWAALRKDMEYTFPRREWLDGDGARGVELVVMWEGLDPYRVDFTESPPRIFYVTTILWQGGAIVSVNERHHVATEEEALDRFDEVKALVTRGR